MDDRVEHRHVRSYNTHVSCEEKKDHAWHQASVLRIELARAKLTPRVLQRWIARDVIKQITCSVQKRRLRLCVHLVDDVAT